MKCKRLFILITLFCAGISNMKCVAQNERNIKTDSLIIQKDAYGKAVLSINPCDSLFPKGNLYYIDSTKVYQLEDRAQYKGGQEALQIYLDSCYYNRPGYDYEEYNLTYLYFILFNQDMKILDVRLIRRPSSIDGRFDKLFENALYHSEGNWVPVNAEKKAKYLLGAVRYHFW